MTPPSWPRRYARCRASSAPRTWWCPDCSRACRTSRAWSRRGSSAANRPSRARGSRASIKLRVAFVLKGYPRLSETFIAQEIAALERRGLEILIVSLRRPTDARRHPVHDEIRAALVYLPEYLYREPLRVFRSWWNQRKKSTYIAARSLWLW